MKSDSALERKLTEASLRWPQGKPGLEEELHRIAKDHEQGSDAWRRMWPVLAIVAVLAGIAVLKWP